MATLVFDSNSGQGISEDTLDFDYLFQLNVVSESPTQLRLTSLPDQDDPVVDVVLHGTGFTYGADGMIVSGTVTSLEWTYTSDAGVRSIAFSGGAVDVATAIEFVSNPGVYDWALPLTGDDLLLGSPFGDWMRGGLGADSVFGGAGNDLISGWLGRGFTPGMPSDDYATAHAAEEVNYLRGDEGNDTIQGGFGFDDINGNMGDDSCVGGLGDDWVVGGKDNDALFGNEGGDIVYGNLGNDTCDGGDGADIVRGGQGNDIVKGSTGNDWLSGDRGNDTITGGAGADVFHGSQDAGIDRITDFSLAEGDRIQLDPGTTYAISQVGSDTVLDMGGGHQMVLVGVTLTAQVQAAIFIG